MKDRSLFCKANGWLDKKRSLWKKRFGYLGSICYNFVILNCNASVKNKNFFRIEKNGVKYNLQHVLTRDLDFARMGFDFKAESR